MVNGLRCSDIDDTLTGVTFLQIYHHEEGRERERDFNIGGIRKQHAVFSPFIFS